MAHLDADVRSLRLGGQGRVVTPAEIRRRLGVNPGDRQVAWVEGNRLVPRPRRAVEEELWAMFSGIDGSLAEEILAERRREVAPTG